MAYAAFAAEIPATQGVDIAMVEVDRALELKPGWDRAEPKMVTPVTLESVSKPSTNSPMMRKIRQESLAAKSSIGSRVRSKLFSFNVFRPTIIGDARRARLSALELPTSVFLNVYS